MKVKRLIAGGLAALNLMTSSAVRAGESDPPADALVEAPRLPFSETPFQNFFKDGAYIFTLPFRKEYRKTTLTIASVVVISSLADDPVQKHFYPNRKEETPDEFRHGGDMLQFAGLAYGTAMGLYGVVSDDADARLEGVLSYETFIWSAAALGTLKWIAGRRRPSESGNPYRFIFREHGSSFPSGHTTQAFAAATLISERYRKWYVTIPAYAAASSVGVSRALANKHWVSDVVAGAALGTFVAHALRLRYKGRADLKAAWRLEPTAEGIQLVHEF